MRNCWRCPITATPPAFPTSTSSSWPMPWRSAGRWSKMTEKADLARHFQAARLHLGAVAYRMLGSVDDAEDAVQEAWLRLAADPRRDGREIANLDAWLTTVVARVCLNTLRSRR